MAAYFHRTVLVGHTCQKYLAAGSRVFLQIAHLFVPIWMPIMLWVKSYRVYNVHKTCIGYIAGKYGIICSREAGRKAFTQYTPETMGRSAPGDLPYD